MIPTCHRTQLESIIEDEDFISACENADSVARSTYEQEAKHIDKIQKKFCKFHPKKRTMMCLSAIKRQIIWESGHPIA